MKKLLFQVDAFTSKAFGGNPAAVVPLSEWLPDAQLQNIAKENNLSETAFYVPHGDGFHIRWFTPTVEVNLCGHATLATSHVLFQYMGFSGEKLEFSSRSGKLTVTRDGDLYILNFPADVPQEVSDSDLLLKCFDRQPVATLKGNADYLVVFDDEAYIKNARPDLSLVKQLDAEGVIITAPATGDVDFVSRFFAPQLGIPEDPVTGSAHTVLVPYWSKQLGKQEFQARQVSQRGGELRCRIDGDRVEIGGQGVTYLEGIINF